FDYIDLTQKGLSDPQIKEIWDRPDSPELQSAALEADAITRKIAEHNDELEEMGYAPVTPGVGNGSYIAAMRTAVEEGWITPEEARVWERWIDLRNVEKMKRYR